MSFTPGGFDIVAQVNTSALDVVVDVILKTIEAKGKTRFVQSIGRNSFGGQVEVQLTDLGVPEVRTTSTSDRFGKGNTLATFEVKTSLTFTVTFFGNGTQFTDLLTVRLKDLQVGVFTTPGGLPVGVALGFDQFDIDTDGLTKLGVLSPVLNSAADLVALGVRTILAPLDAVPVPLFQFADAFHQLGLSFAAGGGSPFLGVSQAGNGVVLAADFERPNNLAAIAEVQDIIPAGSPLNTAAVVHQDLLNQLLATLLSTNQLPSKFEAVAISFGNNSVSVTFADPPQGYAARIAIAVRASAKVKLNLKWYEKLLGKKKKTTVHANLDANFSCQVARDESTNLAVVRFAYAVDLKIKAKVHSVTAAALMTLMAPLLVPFLFLGTQLLNFALKKVLPLEFDFQLDGVDVIDMRVTKLKVSASVGGSLTSATLKVKVSAEGDGTLQLEHLTDHAIAELGIPLRVDYTQQSIETRAGELFLGAALSNA